MNICLFEPDEITKPLRAQDERAQHIIKILHKKEGETFTAGIVNGKSGLASIKAITDEEILFDFEEKGDGKPLYPLRMIIGFPRPIQLKRLLRDVAALGVCEVHLTGTELGEKSYMQSTLLEKGNAYKMLLDGTVQAGGTHVPQIFLHKTLRECVARVTAPFAGDCPQNALLIALDNVAPKKSLGHFMRDNAGDKGFFDGSVVAAIGSERGWTDKEREFFCKQGFTLCGMGERIMRTETAATVAGAIILNEMGVMR